MKPVRRILFVVNVDWFFLSHRLPIALEALRRGYEVHVATGVTEHLETLRAHGLIIHPLHLERKSQRPDRLLREGYQLLRIFLNVRPHLIHLITIKPVLLGGVAARVAKVPAVVAAVTGLGFVFVDRGRKAKLRKLLASRLYRAAFGHRNLHAIFQNSNDQDSVLDFSGLSVNETTLINGAGVDLREYRVLTTDNEKAPVVLMAARLLAEKGVREFVEAARRLKGISPARFVLVGAPDEASTNSITQLELDEWHKEGVIEYWGYRKDMPEVLTQASIVVLPSYYGEGLPKVLIEAAACGRPVITTDHPGCRDAIENGVTGILVPIRDAQALADAIQTLSSNPARALEMGLAGRDRAERLFDVEQVLDAHFRIYDELLSRI